MEGFAATGEIRSVGARLDANRCLTGADLRNEDGPCLTLDRASIGSLKASGVTVVVGRISLAGTTVSGGILLEGAYLDNSRDSCLLVERSTFRGPQRLRYLQARGEVRISNSRTFGRVLLGDAVLDNPGAVALRFTRNEVGSDVVCGGMTVHGEGRFVGTQITLGLDLEGAVLANPGAALDARGLQAAELALLPGRDVDGTVILERVRVGLLRDDPGRWPRPLRVNGLTYTVLESRCSAHDRALLGRVWGLLQDVTVRFGYKPWRAATWPVVLLAIGGVVYSVSPPPPLKPGESPHFNAWFCLQLPTALVREWRPHPELQRS
ncbi:hypothetical protein ACFFV7_33100 [Nonomuraea spiralis]|uniref:Uncharacterized protein n=1 Tax=Nonomuraea spiralis TaxID=46182 RepID=A0ABV5INH5_9ACTN|nr:hypothetical protein [Nonomuraea spiralis]GGT44008.1 hypothetical protein GCM10010176_104380 [Nonomuraea spiralis]